VSGIRQQRHRVGSPAGSRLDGNESGVQDDGCEEQAAVTIGRQVMAVARAVSMAGMRMAALRRVAIGMAAMGLAFSLPVRMTMVVVVPVIMIVIMVVRGGVRRS
jgi:uncharacterized membrane protein